MQPKLSEAELFLNKSTSVKLKSLTKYAMNFAVPLPTSYQLRGGNRNAMELDRIRFVSGYDFVFKQTIIHVPTYILILRNI